jgi:hypothetical protein
MRYNGGENGDFRWKDYNLSKEYSWEKRCYCSTDLIVYDFCLEVIRKRFLDVKEVTIPRLIYH